MAASPNQSQYINTMVFCVVAGIISLMLLLLIMNANEALREFSPFVITVEVGLILIVVVAIYKIIAYERRTRQAAKNSYNSRLYVNTCPDYWTQVGLNCNNTFVPVDKSNIGFEIKGKPNSPNSNDSFSLATFNNLSVQKACVEARKMINSPWTDVDAVCNSFQL